MPSVQNHRPGPGAQSNSKPQQQDAQKPRHRKKFLPEPPACFLSALDGVFPAPGWEPWKHGAALNRESHGKVEHAQRQAEPAKFQRKPYFP
jgi:hypothetical protein